MNRILISILACSCSALAADVASARLDLRNFGYRLTGTAGVFEDYTDLSFISEDLLLISINQRGSGSVEPLFADGPDSTLVVFDVKRGSVTSTGKMPVE